MRKKLINLTFMSHLVVVLFLLNGCVTNKKTTYFQEYDISQYEADSSFNETYKLQVSDNIFVRVVTPDLRYSEMFNTVPVASPGISATEQSVDLLSYVIEKNGTVTIPFLGDIFVEGKTIAEAKAIIEESIAEYVSEAAVTVKLVNYYVSIIGEVLAPGRYPVYKQRMNIYQALAMAGDIDAFGDRYKVKVIRTTPEGSDIIEFDLTDRSILDSEFYYVMPNDVIYVQPMKGKFFAFDTFPFALILTTITTTILIVSYIQQ